MLFQCWTDGPNEHDGLCLEPRQGEETDFSNLNLLTIVHFHFVASQIHRFIVKIGTFSHKMVETTLGLRPSRKSVDVEVCVQTSSIQTYQTTNIASANQQAQRWAHVQASYAARKRRKQKKGERPRVIERDRDFPALH